MSELLARVSGVSSDAGNDWIDVFCQRGVWQLTRDIVDRWVTRNATFFGMIERFVPPGGTTLELGCGPGRHALGAASLGYRVVGIDVEPRIVKQARTNAEAVGLDHAAAFQLGDMFALDALAHAGPFGAITHGGVMEHFETAKGIRESLRAQLATAPYVIFDVPIDSPKNRALFERDEIFRQLWTPEQWVEDVLAGLNVVAWSTDLHSEGNMTDDLVVALAR